MLRPALFVVKATIAPDKEAAFNEWYDTVRAGEAARVPGCTGMRRYVSVPLDTKHVGAERFQRLDSQTQSIRSACVSRRRCGRERLMTWS